MHRPILATKYFEVTTFMIKKMEESAKQLPVTLQLENEKYESAEKGQ